MSDHRPALAKRAEILVIEDDAGIRKVLKAMLLADGYRVFEAASGESGIAQTGARNPDLVLLDLGLPDREGLEVIAEIRQWSNVPIVVVSARWQERDKIQALDAGADDFVSKPFPPGEVSARIRVCLRRATILEKNATSSTVRFGNITVDLTARRVLLDGRDVHLTPNEYKLLQVMLRHAGRVMTQRQLLKQVWGPEHVNEPQYLRVFMCQLRRKLEADSTRPRYLFTEPGVGYRLLTEPEDPLPAVPTSSTMSQ